MKLTPEKLKKMIEEQIKQVAPGPQIQPMRAGDRLVLDVNQFRSVKNTSRPALQIARMQPNNLESLGTIKDKIEEIGIDEFMEMIGERGQMKTPRYKLRAWVTEDEIRFQEYESAEFDFSIDR